MKKKKLFKVCLWQQYKRKLCSRVIKSKTRQRINEWKPVQWSTLHSVLLLAAGPSHILPGVCEQRSRPCRSGCLFVQLVCRSANFTINEVLTFQHPVNYIYSSYFPSSADALTKTQKTTLKISSNDKASQIGFLLRVFCTGFLSLFNFNFNSSVLIVHDRGLYKYISHACMQVF